MSDPPHPVGISGDLPVGEASGAVCASCTGLSSGPADGGLTGETPFSRIAHFGSLTPSDVTQEKSFINIIMYQIIHVS